MDPRLQRRIQRYGWDLAGAHYERYWQQQLAPAQERMLEMANIRKGERVLDVACGTGLVTFPAAAATGPGGRVLATDVSEQMVELARRLAADRGVAHLVFRRADAEDLGLDGERFDVGLCALGLMYFPDPVNALRGMREALDSGGRTAAAVWGRRDRCGWADIFPIVDARVESEVCPLFFHLGSAAALGGAFEAAGYQDLEIDTLETVLHYDNEEDACGAAFSGGPVALAYSRFDEATRAAVHSEYLESIAPYRDGDGYRIPGEFIVARGVNP